MSTSNEPAVAVRDDRGLGYLIGAGVFVVLTGLLTLVRGGRSPGRTTEYFVGEMFGSVVFSAVLAAIIYAIARAATRKKPPATAAKILFWIFLVWFILMLGSTVAQVTNPRAAGAQEAFTQAERHGLTVAPDSIRHPGLGFALPNPGPGFVTSPELERAFADEFGGQLPADLVYFAFRDTAGAGALVLQVVKLPGLNETKFRDVGRGIRKGMAKARIISDTTIWNATRHEARMLGQHPNGAYLAFRCLPSLKPGAEYVVCAQTFTPEPTGLEAIRNGLTVR